jgi:hypothetical protein
MNDPERMQEDEQLKALFDATAEEPSREVLDRLARHAALVPERAPRGVLGWLRQRWWSPLALGFAAVTVAAVAWIVMRTPGQPPGRSVAPVAQLTAPQPSSSAAQPDELLAFADETTVEELESTMVMLETTPLEDALDDGDDLDPLAALDVGRPLEGFGLFDVLIAPDDDAEFERWAGALQARAGGL